MTLAASASCLCLPPLLHQQSLLQCTYSYFRFPPLSHSSSPPNPPHTSVGTQVVAHRLCPCTRVPASCLNSFTPGGTSYFPMNGILMLNSTQEHLRRIPDRNYREQPLEAEGVSVSLPKVFGMPSLTWPSSLITPDRNTNAGVRREERANGTIVITDQAYLLGKKVKVLCEPKSLAVLDKL